MRFWKAQKQSPFPLMRYLSHSSHLAAALNFLHLSIFDHIIQNMSAKKLELSTLFVAFDTEDLKCKIELEIVLRGFHFPKGPSWCCVGDVFWVLGGHFGINFQAFSRRPSSQQSENAKSRF